MPQPVSKDETLVIYLRDNDVDRVHWRSPDGNEMTAKCDVEVIRDGHLRCVHCGEFDASVIGLKERKCIHCIEEDNRTPAFDDGNTRQGP